MMKISRENTQILKGLAILLVGKISYELYLSYVLFLDWLKYHTTINGFIFYALLVIITTIVLYRINYFVKCLERSIDK